MRRAEMGMGRGASAGGAGGGGGPVSEQIRLELAKEVAVSRSALASRFSEVLDTPPMTYLAQWRVRLATNLLEDPRLSIGEVASRVGYVSESAFHRAFKREMGEPPATWRRVKLAGRADP